MGSVKSHSSRDGGDISPDLGTGCPESCGVVAGETCLAGVPGDEQDKAGDGRGHDGGLSRPGAEEGVEMDDTIMFLKHVEEGVWEYSLGSPRDGSGEGDLGYPISNLDELRDFAGALLGMDEGEIPSVEAEVPLSSVPSREATVLCR